MHENQVLDHTITQQVSQTLRAKGLHSPCHITIMVQDGAVMLSGDIESEHQRHTAIQAVRHIQGVRAVIDRMHVPT
jgi:osmotically-inducible protein OsmY